MYNSILEWINQVIVNIVQNYNIIQTYLDKDDPWLVVLAVAAFEIISTTNRLKGYSLDQ